MFIYKKKKYKNIAWDLIANPILESSFPTYIYIEPTNDCSLNCSICPNKIFNAKTGYLNFDLFKKIIKETAKFDCVKTITLHKEGEPLLHLQLPKMIKYIKTKSPSVMVSFSTNGLSLNKEIIEKLLMGGLDKIYVSLGNILTDSKKDKSKTKLIDTVSRNLNYFLIRRGTLKKQRPQIILRTITKKGKYKITEAAKTKWHAIADKIETRPYHTWCGYFKRCYPIPKNRTPCLSLWTTLAVNWNGDVSICSLDYKKEGVVGNVKKSTLQEIWKGDRLKYYRKLHLEGDYHCLKPCQYCTEWRHNTAFWIKKNISKAKHINQ